MAVKALLPQNIIFLFLVLIPEKRIPQVSSQAAVSDHPEVFTLTLPLSGRQMWQAWEPCN
jgi:hypothetical protein